MAVYTHLAARVFGRPHMISEDKLRVIASIIRDRIAGVAPEPVSAQFRDPALATRGTIAVIPVIGTLVQRTGGMEAASGLRSYASIRQDFDAALQSKAKTIVFEVDSPGGEVSGAFDLADYIHSVAADERAKSRNKGRRIVAYVNEMALSAAYLIASATQSIIMPETGMVGSIGVIAMHIDQSAADAAAGLKYTAVYAGAHKNDLSPHEPLSDDARTLLQGRVDSVYDMFVERVAAYRNVSVDVVRGTDAAILTPRQAIEAHLVDSVQSWTDFIAGMRAGAKRQKGGGYMTKDELLAELHTMRAEAGEQVFAEAVASLMPAAEAGVDMEAAITEAREAGFQMGLSRAGMIAGMCELAGLPHLTSQYLAKTDMDETAVRQALQAAKQQAASQPIFAAVGADLQVTGQSRNPSELLKYM